MLLMIGEYAWYLNVSPKSWKNDNKKKAPRPFRRQAAVPVASICSPIGCKYLYDLAVLQESRYGLFKPFFEEPMVMYDELCVTKCSIECP